MKRLLIGVLCTAILSGLCACGAAPVTLDGATLVTFGASNTSLSDWPAETAKALNMNLVNAGIGGNTTAHAVARFDRDVASADPDFVTICFGTNDFYRKNGTDPQVSPAEYRTNLLDILARTEALGAIPILITSPAITETASGGAARYPEGSVNAALDVYVEVMRQVAEDTDTHLIDIHKLSEQDYSAAEFLSGDGVHMSPLGDKAFADAVIAYMKEHFRSDPHAPRVEQPTAPTAQKGSWTKSLLPANAEEWLVIYPDTIDVNATGNGIRFTNTIGDWPEVHYSPKLPDTIAAPVTNSYLTVDLKLEASANILLFFGGNTPTVASNDDYLSLTAAIKKKIPSLRVVGDDIQGGQTVKCTIPLLELTGGRFLRDDATVLFSGVKVFVIGQAGKSVTINELSITTT